MDSIEAKIREAEEVVGSYIYLDPNQYYVVEVLKMSGYVGRSLQFRELLDVVNEGMRRGMVVNLRVQLSALARRYWEEVSSKHAVGVEFGQRVEECLRFLVEVARSDRMRVALERCLRELDPFNVGEVLGRLLDEMSMVASSEGVVVSGGHIAGMMEAYWERVYTYKKYPVYTHIGLLDSSGVYLARREYSLISGRTGVGKTSCAAIMAYNMLMSHERNDEYAAPYPLRVLYLSTEMPSEAIVAKILGAFCRGYVIPRLEELNVFENEREVEVARRLRWTDYYVRTREENLEVIKKVVRLFVKTCGDRLAVYHSPVVTSRDVFMVGMGQALRWRAMGGSLDVYIVDFIQNIRTRGELEGGRFRDGMSISRELALVSQEFQHFCNRFEVAGLLLSQVNDVGEVRDSRVLEHLSALHIQVGIHQRNLSGVIREYLQQVGMVGGKVVGHGDIGKVATEYARAIMRGEVVSGKRLLDMRVVKNRYGGVVRGVQFVVWDASIPWIDGVYGMDEVLERVERYRASGSSSDNVMEYSSENVFEGIPF